MKKVFAILLAIVCLTAQKTTACTSVIVSGKATKDGRPIIFKNRDTGTLENRMLVLQGQRFRFVGLVNTADTLPENVWGGHNEAGFAIINTAAFNLNGDEGDTDGDGILIRKALGLCASVEDFQTLLDTIAKPMNVNSNFGVLDAHGCCAYFETGHYKYVKFDVNDPTVAPDGYLMRTNFGTTGNHKLDQGVERFCAITDYMNEAVGEGKFDATRLITSIPRYFTHGLTKWKMEDFMPATENDVQMFPVSDYITRYSTASAILVQGVLPDEKPENTVSWTIIGSPMTAVAVPVVLLPSGKLPQMLGDDGTGCARLNTLSLTLKNRIFSLQNGNTKAYIDLSKLMNRAQTGTVQLLQPVEQEIIKKGVQSLEKLRKKRNYASIESYYQWVDDYLAEQYRQLFGL
ncbi:MAG: acyl-CoA--6-aminopenicillanic acid acyl-transferase [Prevotella sp.]|nr:acyl-CoA--6-aminopenicillanic acid acyl-transferase [Prevotella sp.]